MSESEKARFGPWETDHYAPTRIFLILLAMRNPTKTVNFELYFEDRSGSKTRNWIKLFSAYCFGPE